MFSQRVKDTEGRLTNDTNAEDNKPRTRVPQTGDLRGKMTRAKKVKDFEGPRSPAS